MRCTGIVQQDRHRRATRPGEATDIVCSWSDGHFVARVMILVECSLGQGETTYAFDNAWQVEIRASAEEV